MPTALVPSRRTILCAATLALFWPWPSPASPAAAPVADPSAAIDTLFKSSFPADGPGAAVIVVKDGRTLFRKAYGMANLELGVPLQPDMVFRLGSITKQFTATAILMLAEEGKLSLLDPIEKHLPGYPTQGHAITIEHLLTHTSGIQSYTDMPGWMTSRIQGAMTVTELVDGFKKEPMQFAPGEKWAYNNSAYILLGAIVEKASGKTYEAFVRERIFEPLGMTSSVLRPLGGDPPEAGVRLHAGGRPAEKRPLPQHDAALLGGLAGLDRGRPRAVGRLARHGEAAEEGLARPGLHSLRPEGPARRRDTATAGASRRCAAGARSRTAAASSASPPTRCACRTSTSTWRCSATATRRPPLPATLRRRPPPS